jgi:cytidine deaminase
MKKFLTDDQVHHLIAKAQEASLNAYAPYSNFQVGCAILLDDGSIFKGANIENVSYSVTLCAERVALSAVVSQKKTNNIQALIVVTNTNPPSSPCGACRQFMSEFLDPNVSIILSNNAKEIILTTMGELLPLAFNKRALVK